MCGHLLFGNAIQRAVIVEAEIASVDDVVCAGIGGELVQRLQVSFTTSAYAIAPKTKVMLTSDVGNAENSYASLLDHAALVGKQRDSSRRWARGDTRSAAVGKVIAWVGARLIGSLLDEVSIDVTCGGISAGVPDVLKPWSRRRRGQVTCPSEVCRRGDGGRARAGRGRELQCRD